MHRAFINTNTLSGLPSTLTSTYVWASIVLLSVLDGCYIGQVLDHVLLLGTGLCVILNFFIHGSSTPDMFESWGEMGRWKDAVQGWHQDIGRPWARSLSQCFWHHCLYSSWQPLMIYDCQDPSPSKTKREKNYWQHEIVSNCKHDMKL